MEIILLSLTFKENQFQTLLLCTYCRNTYPKGRALMTMYRVKRREGIYFAVRQFLRYVHTGLQNARTTYFFISYIFYFLRFRSILNHQY